MFVLITVNTTCNGNIMLSASATRVQQFASPGFPGGYPPEQYCEWIIAGARDREEIVLRTNNFQTDDSEDCKLDHVTIYEGGTVQ